MRTLQALQMIHVQCISEHVFLHNLHILTLANSTRQTEKAKGLDNLDVLFM